MIRASIIIPALNEAENLSRSLPSLYSQLQSTDELIVVDNGSRDRTAEVARQFGAKVICEPIRGRSRARNAGIRTSSGEFFVFLDADCRPCPNWLNLLLEPFQKPEIGCVAGEIRIQFLDNPLGGYLSSKGHLSQKVNFAHSFLPYAGSGNVAFRGEVLRRIGGFDEDMYSGHDADLCWRMQLETPFTITLVTDAVVDHRQAVTLAALTRQKRRHAFGSVLLYKKYRNRGRRENRTLKQVYWEYRSILQRGTKFLIHWLGARIGVVAELPPEQGYQLLLEMSDRLGRIEGSLALRVWYP